jgi:hypothetical protein
MCDYLPTAAANLISTGKSSGRAAWPPHPHGKGMGCAPRGRDRFGPRLHGELQQWCQMGTEWPTVGQWRAWHARFRPLLRQHTARKDIAGTFARRLTREGEALWVFLDVPGVDVTNNVAERAHQLAYCGANGARGHAVRKGTAGWNGFCRSGTPVACAIDLSHLGRRGVMPVQQRET